MGLELVVDNSQAVREEALAWPDRAAALAVVDDATCVQASELLKGIKALRLRIAETFDPHIKRAHDAHKALLKEKQDAEGPLTVAERVLKDRLVAYEQVQETARAARERELQQQAQREEETRRLNDAAALEREAAALNDPSLLYEAEALLEQPIVAPLVTLPSTTPKVAGVTYRESWKADPAVDVKALAAAVASGAAPVTLLLPNLPALNQLARATKGTHPVPGVRFVRERLVAAGVR
jgi:hypothetical protein